MLANSVVYAGNFTVTNSSDTGPGSLRQAIISANASSSTPHTITYTSDYTKNATTTLLSNLPIITAAEVRFRGSDRNPKIHGGDLYSIFRAAPDVSLDIRDMSFYNGLNASGGCISTTQNGGSGSLTVTHSQFYYCKARSDDSPGGGAIRWHASAPAEMVVSDSVFYSNDAISTNMATEQPRGGAIDSSVQTVIEDSLFAVNSIATAGNRGGFGGAVSLSLPGTGTSVIRDSWFVQNAGDATATSLDSGGAVRAYIQPGGYIQLERNTFSGNQAREGAALDLKSAMLSTTTSVFMTNNTFYDNTSTADGGAVKFGDMKVSANHNTFYNNQGSSGSHLSFVRVMVQAFFHNVLAVTKLNAACLIDSSTTAVYLAGNLFDEACGILSSTGGSISNNLAVKGIINFPDGAVVEFMDGADPIDGGTTDPGDCAATDARGTPRPLDGDNDGIAVCDVGAYEAPGESVFRDSFETLTP